MRRGRNQTEIRLVAGFAPTTRLWARFGFKGTRDVELIGRTLFGKVCKYPNSIKIILNASCLQMPIYLHLEEQSRL